MADQPTASPEGEGNGQGIGFAIERIYVKDLSLESPGAPQSFQMTEAPESDVISQFSRFGLWRPFNRP